MTVTTASQALFGMALKEYFRDHGDSLTDMLTFASQYSLMPPPRTREEIRAGNFATAVLFKCALEDDIATAIKR